VGVSAHPFIKGIDMTATTVFTSKAGERLTFEVCNFAGNWSEYPGIYMMSALINQGREWHPKYIGKAKSFKDRLCGHDQWAPAVRLGATHVLAMIVPTESERDRLEAMLIAEINPPLNVQLRQPVGLGAMAPRGLPSPLEPRLGAMAPRGIIGLAR
jgi:hypothetical protein